MKDPPGWIRFGKFTLVGWLGAALQLAALYLLTSGFQVRTFFATPVAVEIALLHNFAWHERFTWRERGVMCGRGTVARLFRFQLSNGLVSLVGNSVLIYILTRKLRLPVLPSAIAAIAACGFANFLLADRWCWVGRDNAVPL